MCLCWGGALKYGACCGGKWIGCVSAGGGVHSGSRSIVLETDQGPSHSEEY